MAAGWSTVEQGRLGAFPFLQGPLLSEPDAKARDWADSRLRVGL